MVKDMWYVKKPEFTFVRQKDRGKKKPFVRRSGRVLETY
jgi:hypothetical protein